MSGVLVFKRNPTVEIYQSAVAMANIMALIYTVKNSGNPLRPAATQSGRPVPSVSF